MNKLIAKEKNIEDNSPSPKDVGKKDGILRTEEVTPETLFCIGFNKAFSSSLRVVAILTISTQY